MKILKRSTTNGKKQERENNGNIDSVSVCSADARNDRPNGNGRSFDFANANAFASLKMTNDICHSERSEESRRYSTQCCHPELDSESTLKNGLRVKPAMTNRAAFTLVELVITIAIVIILSVISVPIYRGYIDKAKMSEGYALMGIILSAQKAYYSQHGNFLSALHASVSADYHTNNETVLGVDARGNKYFTWFFVGTENVGKEKYYFNCGAYGPEDLWKDGTTRLCLQYNLTKGSKIVKLPSEWDSTWLE